MGDVVPIFPIFFLSVSGLELLDRQLVSDALHSVNSGDELNDPLHIGRTAHFAGQGDNAFFRLDADAARDRRKIRRNVVSAWFVMAASALLMPSVSRGWFGSAT